MQGNTSTRRLLRSGAIAGAASALAFTALHHLLISDIWFSLVPMLAAGAACGLCVAWSYGLLFRPVSVTSWLMYNLVWVALLVLLGATSIVVYEPIASIPALLAANEPPRELFARAMPLTVGFILASAALIAWLWGRTPLDVASVLLTCTVLTLLLGLNVSVLGLVYIPAGGAYLVLELFGLILALNAVYVLVLVLLEQRQSLRVEVAEQRSAGASLPPG